MQAMARYAIHVLRIPRIVVSLKTHFCLLSILHAWACVGTKAHMMHLHGKRRRKRRRRKRQTSAVGSYAPGAQKRISPAAAPARISQAELILKRRRITKAITAMAQVRTSTRAFCPNWISTPAIRAKAAALTPSSKGAVHCELLSRVATG